MGQVRFEITMSLDGFVAGPNQGPDHPLGEGGERLHEWAYGLDAWRSAHGREGGETNPSSAVMEQRLAATGATIMGRNMFGGGPGPWGDDPWEGWWGDEPPFHQPVFVLTHHAREPLEKQGGTTFTFVTEGIEAALEQATAAAGDSDVLVAGGASAGQQYMNAGLLDRVDINLVPVLLGSGERLFANVDPARLTLEQTASIDAPGVAHLSYRASA